MAQHPVGPWWGGLQAPPARMQAGRGAIPHHGLLLPGSCHCLRPPPTPAEVRCWGAPSSLAGHCPWNLPVFTPQAPPCGVCGAQPCPAFLVFNLLASTGCVWDLNSVTTAQVTRPWGPWAQPLLSATCNLTLDNRKCPSQGLLAILGPLLPKALVMCCPPL